MTSNCPSFRETFFFFSARSGVRPSWLTMVRVSSLRPMVDGPFHGPPVPFLFLGGFCSWLRQTSFSPRRNAFLSSDPSSPPPDPGCPLFPLPILKMEIDHVPSAASFISVSDSPFFFAARDAVTSSPLGSRRFTRAPFPVTKHSNVLLSSLCARPFFCRCEHLCFFSLLLVGRRAHFSFFSRRSVVLIVD